MMVAVRRRRLVTRNPVPGVDTLHKPELGERLERAVDGRDSDRPAGLAKLIEDLLRAQAAVLAPEQVDHRATCAATPKAGELQGFEGITRPSHFGSVSSG